MRINFAGMLLKIGLFTSLLVFARAVAPMHRLFRNLLKDYEKDVRPSHLHSEALVVEFGFSLAQIIDIDEKNQILTTNAWIKQRWTDYSLTWNHTDYDDISVIHIPHERVWLPDIVLYNNADSHYNQALVSTDVFVTADGRVTWLLGAIFKSSCAMNVRYYPFDEQICYLKFASWSYGGHLMDLYPEDNGTADMTNYMTSTEWDLLGMKSQRNVQNYSCCPDEPYPDVVIKIHIKRKPMFYVFNLILPCCLITGIALLGFYMPADSGEKVTLGITTLLSVTVFLMLVAESMPPTSDTLPLIGMYYGVTICLVSLATALTVFTLNIHHKGLRGNPVPRFVKIIAFKYVAPFLFVILDPPDHWSLYGDENFPVDAEKPSSGASMNYVKADYTKTPELEPLTSTSVPMMDTKFVNGGLTPSLTMRVRSLEAVSSSSGTEKATQGTESTKNDFEAQFVRVLQKVYSSIQKNELRLMEQDRKDAIKLEWQQVALVVDRFLLIVFVVTTTLVSLGIMYQRQLLFG